ncbi:hypothetical protein CesoFtcFv8_027092 [Champsocephalus esox]|uniref:Uncharacterized protein n=1 Tax=Champsocephalus esox TaxID=159716 RepID=A0AAN8B0Y9_9TELE|nr:hypothetical protein CesoFtcFv8_027092 [Champsocephalus esox]
MAVTQPRPDIMNSGSGQWTSDICDCLDDLPQCTSLRVSIRQRYGIEGTICNDCVYACCCGPCSWCQIAREIKTRANPITFVSMAS